MLFSIFSSCLATLLYSFGYAISINSIVFFDVFSNVRSRLRAMYSVLIGFSKYQKNIFLSFSITFPLSELVMFHFVSSVSSPFSTAHFIVNTFKVLLRRLTYFLATSFLPLDRRRCTVSL